LENYDLYLVAAYLQIHTTKHPPEKQLQVCHGELSRLSGFYT